MRLLLILLLVSSVLTDEKLTNNVDKKGETKKVLKTSADESKSKTGKRDSSDQTSTFGLNTNDEPFKPMLNSPAPFEAAASATQQVYYDKNQLKAVEGAGNAKSDTNPQAANSYRPQYTQVPHQQPTKNHLRAAVKNVVIQQQQQQQHQVNNQPNILYAVPQNPAYHYERIPQQQQQHQQQQPIPAAPAPLPLPAQRSPQKPVQYVIAIPMSYLRQLQQQFLHQQQQTQQPPQPQQQQPQQIQMIPVYSIAGPLARDNHGSYRPFHRFAPAAVNDVSNTAQQQTVSSAPLVSQSLVSNAPASPGFVTQYVQIPASVLLAAAQMAHQQQQQRPIHLPQNVYTPPQHQQQQQQQQPMIQLQLQQPLNQQHAQTQSPQLYYYQPQQHQQQQQQVPLKPSPTLASPPPVYAFNVNQLQPQPTQLHQTYQPLPEQQQQQQQQQPINVGKQQQPHRFRGVRPTANFKPSQYDTSSVAYANDEKAQLVTFQAPAHINLNTHSHTNAHSQQYIAQPGPVAQQQQQSAPTHQQIVQAQAPEAYEPVAHYNPQYVQHHLGQHQQPRQHQPHRLQIQPSLPSQQHVPLVEHINNLPFSQAIQGPTPLPFLRLQPAAAVTPFYPPALPHSFLSGSFQPPFTPLGTPSKVTSFTNVLLQPFIGHPPSFSSAEIGTSGPFVHQNGGVRYATHVYHPPTSANSLPIKANNKHQNAVVVSQLHPAPRALSTAGDLKVSAASAKADAAVAAGPTIVKYP